MDLDTFRRYTEWHDHVNQRSYEAPADPWKLVSIDPAEIEHCAPGIGLYGLGRVEGGDWDQDPRTVADLFVYEGLVQRFDEGRDWEETRYVEWAREQFESGERPRYYEDLNAFLDRRCEYVDDLYERIARGTDRTPRPDTTTRRPRTTRSRTPTSTGSNRSSQSVAPVPLLLTEVPSRLSLGHPGYRRDSGAGRLPAPGLAAHP